MHEPAGLTCLLSSPPHLHLDFEGVEGVYSSLAGCTSHCSGDNIVDGLVAS